MTVSSSKFISLPIALLAGVVILVVGILLWTWPEYSLIYPTPVPEPTATPGPTPKPLTCYEPSEAAEKHTGSRAKLAGTYGDSPDGNFRAMRIESEGGTTTYLIDATGKRVTGWCPGSIHGWSSSSKFAILFISNFQSNDGGRHVYYLEPDGDFYDSGLPEGTTNADISLVDGSVVYAITQPGGDRSTMYIRDVVGKERLLVPNEGMILAWLRWSPQGDKIAYLQADLGLSKESMGLWVINVDGTERKKISRVDWSKPPVWSADGTKLMFTLFGEEKEYFVE